MPTGVQFGIAYSLIVNNSDLGVDLSSLRFRFTIKSKDLETPNTCQIRIYNAAPTTVDAINKGEFTKVTLQAGYQGQVNYGIIFQGDIKRVYIGRERNVDSYIEILAADGDQAYNFAVVNTTVGPNSTPEDRFKAASQSVEQFGLTVQQDAANAFANTGGILPRGAILFGMWRSVMGDLANSANVRWSIQNGVVTVIRNDGYLPGEAVVLNSTTGLVGVPEVTDNGVNVRMNLNAKLRIGGLVQINQALINKQLVLQQGYPNYTNLYFPAQTASDGLYRVLAMDHTGDTRGQDWYTDIVCLALHVAPAGSQQQYSCSEFPM